MHLRNYDAKKDEEVKKLGERERDSMGRKRRKQTTPAAAVVVSISCKVIPIGGFVV